MKLRTLIYSILSLTLGLGAMAQTKHDVVGIWQMVVIDNEGDPSYLPVFKEIRKDGSFVLFRQTKITKPFRITQFGTYKMLNDSTMREHIDQTINTLDLLGKDSDVMLRFNQDGRILISTFFIPGNPNQFQEIWVRLALPQIRKEELPSNFSTM